ncbi:MAG: DUF6701 domain-containing protein [Thermodesulfobacteriota bacterium]
MAPLLTASTFLALILFTLTPTSWAATYVYDDTVAYSWQSSSPTNVTWSGTCTTYLADDDQQLVNIGFTFNFADIDYTQVRILSNGALHFGADQGFHKDYTNEAMPITEVGAGPCAESAADRVIAPYWEDLDPSGGGQVTYETMGSAPNRQFVVSWLGVPRYGAGSSYTFQVILYETSNAFKFQYGAGNANGSSATIGVEVSDTDFTQYSYNSNTVSNGDAILFYRAAHFAISHDGIGDVCQTENITISFHDYLHNIQTPYTGTITLSTSTGTGDWSLVSGSGTLTNLGNGDGTYAFAAGDNSQVILGLTHPATGIVNINIFDGTTIEDPGEDNDLNFSGSGDTFRDDFNVSAFNNNDGSATWTGDWIEVDGAGAGSGTGNVQITGGSLVLDDRPNTGGEPSLAREVNLSFYSNATLSFDYQTTAGVDNNDAVVVEVSNNGGGSWTILETFTGISGATSGSRSYNVTVDSSMSVNTRIRFRVSGRYGGSNEQFLVNFVEISALLPCPGVDHYTIGHDEFGINCQAEPVTISVHDAAHAVLTGHTGAITLSTSSGHGDWSVISGNPSNLVNIGNGNGSYTFDGSELGVVVLGLKDTFVETVNINISDGTATELSGTAEPLTEDLDIAFAQAGFNFLAGGVGNAIGNQIGAKPSSTAPGNQVLQIEGIRTNDLTGQCEAALVGINTIDLGFECLDPTTCTANLVNISGTNIAANNNGAVASYTGVTLDFGTNLDTTATFTMSYPDVGQIRLHARYDIPLGSGLGSGNLMIGSSNNFVVRPFGFDVTASGNPLPATTTAVGTVYTSAGTPFAANVRAVLWEAADDSDNDGIPDNHTDTNPANNVDLLDNTAALNFGQETTAEDVLLTTYLFLPAGTNPGLAGNTTVSGFVAGAGSSNVRYDEVGIIELIANLTDNSYLGAGKATGRSGHVGRFRPAYFDVTINPSPPAFTDSCVTGNFTYLGEPFPYAITPNIIITAYNAATPAAVTANYDCGGFWKFAAPMNLAYTYNDASGSGLTFTPAGNSVNPIGADTTDCNGVVPLPLTDTFSYSRPPVASPKIPFAATVDLAVNNLQLTDSDGTCYNTGAGCQGFNVNGITGANLRHGKIQVFNSFGPETQDITTAPFEIQYWDDFDWDTNYEWAINTNEDATSCTTEASIGFCTDNANHAVSLDAGSLGSFVSGAGTITVGHDPANFSRIVRVCPINPAKLTSLAGCGAINEKCGDFTFGIYRGNDRIINWREIVK